MKKTLFSLGLLSLALILLGVSLLPQEAEAAPPYLCTNYSNTVEKWGTGATCAEAEQDLRSQLNPLVTQACSQSPFSGSCGSSLVITGACHSVSPGEKMVDGYMSYRCRFYPDL